MSEPLKCGVIGVGYLGRFHAQKFKDVVGGKLVGVFDENLKRSQEVAAEVGVQSFSSPQSLLSEVEAVSVASTTSSHHELVRMALRLGKHVFVEKPIAVTSVQARDLCELACEKNLLLQVGHIERFNPVWVATRDKIRAPQFFECRRLAPFKPRGIDVSVVSDLMIHDIDLVLSLVDSPVKKIVAAGSRQVTMSPDTAIASLEFESGIVAHFTASRIAEVPERRMGVVTQDGVWDLNLGNGTARLGQTSKKVSLDPSDSPVLWGEQSVMKFDALQAEIQAFVTSVREGKPAEVTGFEGLRAVEIVEQIESVLKCPPQKF